MTNQRKKTLYEKYPPSPPCSCKVCVSYCKRPGWWIVQEVRAAMDAGYASRMMLEMSPELNFGIISPAFKGCEGNVALQIFSEAGCTFFKNSRCELHGTGFQPLECRFSHHLRRGLGPKCHGDIEKEWNTPEGQQVVKEWLKRTTMNNNNSLNRLH